MNMTFHHAQQHTDTIWTLWFLPEYRLRYIAGQYIEIFLPHVAPDNRRQHRWMTISSAPHNDMISITTRFVSHRQSSYKQALQHLQPGTVVHTSEPIGDFVLPKDPTIPVVFVAAGIGITPVKSIIEDMVHHSRQHPVEILYAARTPSDLLFLDSFLSNSVRLTPVLSQPDTHWQGETGHLSGKRVLSLTDYSDQKLFFLSGPESLIPKIIAELYELGVRRDQIVMDYFPGY